LIFVLIRQNEEERVALLIVGKFFVYKINMIAQKGDPLSLKFDN
jgi:hypothetical protein